MQEASELEYLRWFAANADFGPADSDVIIYMQKEFVRDSGKLVPKEWRYGDEEGE